MHELYVRMTAVDASAGAALKVIAYFDRLVKERASLEALVRGAAVLSGSAARLVDVRRGIRIRIDPDGRRGDDDRPPEAAWPRAVMAPGDTATLWLETPSASEPVVAMVLERAAAAVEVVLDRTTGPEPADDSADDPSDEALIGIVCDAAASDRVRLLAAARLGLHEGATARAVALWEGTAEVEAAPSAGIRRPHESRREGVGPAVPVVDLPASWEAAKTALLFTAEGTEQDPGSRSVAADDLGSGLMLLAEAVDDGTPSSDVGAIDRIVGSTPRMAATMHKVATCTSVRHAAKELNVHHSTLQGRVERIEHKLGWPVRDAHGRLRLLLAMILWRLHRNRTRLAVMGRHAGRQSPERPVTEK